MSSSTVQIGFNIRCHVYIGSFCWHQKEDLFIGSRFWTGCLHHGIAKVVNYFWKFYLQSWQLKGQHRPCTTRALQKVITQLRAIICVQKLCSIPNAWIRPQTMLCICYPAIPMLLSVVIINHVLPDLSASSHAPSSTLNMHGWRVNVVQVSTITWLRLCRELRTGSWCFLLACTGQKWPPLPF